MKYTFYALISPDKEDAAFLEERFQINDDALVRFARRKCKRLLRSLKRWDKSLDKACSKEIKEIKNLLNKFKLKP